MTTIFISDLSNLINQTIFVRILDPTLVAHFCSSAPKEGKFPKQNITIIMRLWEMWTLLNRNFVLIFDVGYFDTSLKSKAITFFSFGGDLKFIAFTSMASSISWRVKVQRSRSRSKIDLASFFMVLRKWKPLSASSSWTNALKISSRPGGCHNSTWRGWELMRVVTIITIISVKVMITIHMISIDLKPSDDRRQHHNHQHHQHDHQQDQQPPGDHLFWASPPPPEQRAPALKRPKILENVNTHYLEIQAANRYNYFSVQFLKKLSTTQHIHIALTTPGVGGKMPSSR